MTASDASMFSPQEGSPICRKARSTQFARSASPRCAYREALCSGGQLRGVQYRRAAIVVGDEASIAALPLMGDESLRVRR